MAAHRAELDGELPQGRRHQTKERRRESQELGQTGNIIFAREMKLRF